MVRWLVVVGFALLLWVGAGWAGATMGGPEMGPRTASAGEVPMPIAPAWVPLFHPDLLSPPLSGRRTMVLPLRTAPAREAPSAGRIRVTFDPDRGIHTTWLPPGDRREVPLWPDLHDPDWGYGPWHHQTVLEDRSPWFLLPADPFPSPVWVDFSGLPRPPAVERLEPGMVLVSPRGDVTVLSVGGDEVRVRPEQPGDLWCEGGHPPPPAPAETLVLAGDDLRDPNGHLRIRLKYTRGC